MNERLLRLLYAVRPLKLQRAIARGLGVGRRLVRLPQGFSMVLDPLTHLGSAICFRGGYEPRLTDAVQRILRRGDTFVDLGAHEGYFSMLAATAQPQAAVHSIEPHPASSALIRENVRLNELTNVTVHPIAIADQPGRRPMVAGTHTGSTQFADRAVDAAGFEVETQSLDAFVAEQDLTSIRLMKIDVEGAELLVFRGAAQVLASRVVAYYALDYHQSIIGPDACREIDGRLRAAGYVCSSANGLWLYHLPECQAELAGLFAEILPIPAL